MANSSRAVSSSLAASAASACTVTRRVSSSSTVASEDSSAELAAIGRSWHPGAAAAGTGAGRRPRRRGPAGAGHQEDVVGVPVASTGHGPPSTRPPRLRRRPPRAHGRPAPAGRRAGPVLGGRGRRSSPRCVPAATTPCAACTARFDDVDLDELRVPGRGDPAALDRHPAALQEALDVAHDRILAYHAHEAGEGPATSAAAGSPSATWSGPSTVPGATRPAVGPVIRRRCSCARSPRTWPASRRSCCACRRPRRPGRRRHVGRRRGGRGDGGLPGGERRP